MKARVPWKPTNKQKKAMNVEIYRQIFESIGKLSKNMAAVMLWNLHEQEGWGKKKLLRFYNDFLPALKEMQDYYEMYGAEDTEFMCKYKLKEMGIDLDQMDDIFSIKIQIK